MATLSIHTNDIVGVKHYPENYTDDLIDILVAFSFHQTTNIIFESPIIYGSASIKLSSPSDYDCYQKIKAKNIVSIVNEFKAVIKRLEAFKGLFIADIKAGSIDALRIIPQYCDEDNWDSELSSMIDKSRELFRLKKIDKKELDLCLKYLKPKLRNFDIAIVKKEIRFNIARWTPEEIKKGFLIRRGIKLTLEEAVQQKELTKVDVIGFMVNRYPEISMVYLYEMGGHVLNTGYNEEDRELLLQQTIPPLIYDDNYFKVAKRVFAIERYRERPNLRVLEILMRLFNSDLARLYQIIVDLNVCLYMFDNYKHLDMDKIKYMLNQIRFRTSNFVNKSYQKHETEYLKLLGEFEYDPLNKRHLLEKYKDKLFDLLNTQTKDYLEQNRLLPIPAEYLPYKTENKDLSKRVMKNTSKLLTGKGEMTHYRHQDLLEDNDNDLVGSGIKNKYKKMNLKDLITEHKKLIGVLKKGTPKQRIAEALEQYHELQSYMKSMK
jgi:hypothetical protein